MTTAATSLLGLALPVTGELAGTWGDTVNNSITSLLDSAVAGTTTLSTDGDVTLTTTTLAANQARQAILLCSGARTALRTITAPAQSKIYTIINATTGGFSVKLVGAGPTTGVTIVAGESAVCAWNGSDFIKVSNTGGSASFTNVTVSGTTTLSGLTASTALALNSSKEVVSVTNTGTGNNVLSASPTLTGTVAGASLQLSSLTATRVTYAGASGLLQDSANLTFDGTSLTLGGNPTLSGGTANGVLYLNGSKVATSGSALTFDGSSLKTTGSVLAGGAVPASGAGVTLAYNGSTTGYIYSYDWSASTYKALYVAGNSLQLVASGGTQIQFDVNGSEAMRLTSTGLGIGTSSPDSKLVVQGGSGTYAQIKDGTVNTFIQARSADSVGVLGTLTNHGLAFWTNSASRMTLDTSGNLALGVTPSAWSLGKAIEVNNAGNALWGVAASEINVAQNGYYNSGWKYAASSYASRYEQNTGVHKWWTAPSGTAGNAITFTQAMTLDASGRLAVGTTSASAQFHVLNANGNSGLGSDNTGMALVESTYAANASQANASYIAKNYYGYSQFMQWQNFGVRIGSRGTANGGAGALVFTYGSDSEGARIDSSGNLLVGTTTNIRTSKFVVGGTLGGGTGAEFDNDSSATWIPLAFHTASTLVGYISATTSITTYNSVSDYRLKNVIGNVTGSGARIDALEPVEYEWKENGERTRGFLAHKFQEVYPQSVSGTKDAVDADGNPVYQAMQASTSEVIADLVAEIKSLRARVAQLESN